MVSSLPRILLMLYSELACARRDRNGIIMTLSPHTPSSCSLFLGKKSIAIMFLAQHPVAYNAVRRMMRLIHSKNESHRELF